MTGSIVSPGHAVPAAGTTPALFEATAAAVPDRPAVAMGTTTLTYAELNAEANRLARRLVAHGVGPERLVALVMPRSIEFVIAMLAVHKAGGAYVPVDPDYPEEQPAAHAGPHRGAVPAVPARTGRDRRPGRAERGARGRRVRAGPRRPRPARPAAARPSRVRHLHLGLDRAAEGRGGHAPGDTEPRGRLRAPPAAAAGQQAAGLRVAQFRRRRRRVLADVAGRWLPGAGSGAGADPGGAAGPAGAAAGDLPRHAAAVRAGAAGGGRWPAGGVDAPGRGRGVPGPGRAPLGRGADHDQRLRPDRGHGRGHRERPADRRRHAPDRTADHAASARTSWTTGCGPSRTGRWASCTPRAPAWPAATSAGRMATAQRFLPNLFGAPGSACTAPATGCACGRTGSSSSPAASTTS